MPGRSAITIRPYQDTDLDAVISVFIASIREAATHDYSEAQIAAWAQADRDTWKQARSSRPTWVACVRQSGREEIIGFSDLESNGHLDMMYVHPTHKRRGIASALLSTVEQAAKEQGIGTLTVDASLTARPFFEERGFKLIREQEIPIRGQILRNLRMAKTLR